MLKRFKGYLEINAIQHHVELYSIFPIPIQVVRSKVGYKSIIQCTRCCQCLSPITTQKISLNKIQNLHFWDKSKKKEIKHAI